MPHVLDIADVFDQVHDTIYFDQGHVNALGNRLVAQRIYAVVRRAVRNGRLYGDY